MTRSAQSSGEQTVSNTPFARVLTRFMWSKQPPWSAAKTAAVLGIHRTRVANWVYHDITPDLDTMLIVLARLGIPINALLDAYAEDGVPVPAIIAPAPTAAAPAPATPAAPVTPAEPAEPYAVPGRRRVRAGKAPTGPAASKAVSKATGEAEATTEAGEAPAPTVPAVPAATTDAEWEKMIEHTREVMSMAGMPEAALNALLAELEDTRRGKPSAAQRHIDAEHRPEHQPERPASHRQPAPPSQSASQSASQGRRGDH